MVFYLFEPSPCRRLFTPQSCKPPVKWFQRTHEWFHLSGLAASRWLHDMKLAKLPFELLHCRRRQSVDEIQSPLLRHAIAVFDQLCEVIAGLKKDHWNIRQMLSEHVQGDHVLSLKARR